MHASYTSRFRHVTFLASLPGRSFFFLLVDIDNKAIRYYFGIFYFLFYFPFTSAGNLVFVFVGDCSQGYSECMRRRGQVELHPFDPEPEKTLHRLLRELRTAQYRNLVIMQNNEEHDHGHEQNEPQGNRNGNNGRNIHPGRLYNQMIHSCCYKSLPYHLQLFRRLFEDHLFRQTTSN